MRKWYSKLVVTRSAERAFNDLKIEDMRSYFADKHNELNSLQLIVEKVLLEGAFISHETCSRLEKLLNLDCK